MVAESFIARALQSVEDRHVRHTETAGELADPDARRVQSLDLLRRRPAHRLARRTELDARGAQTRTHRRRREAVLAGETVRADAARVVRGQLLLVRSRAGEVGTARAGALARLRRAP